MDDDAEEVVKQELTQLVTRLDEHDRQREKLRDRVSSCLKDLAKARGVAFMRLETFRDELRREGNG